MHALTRTLTVTSSSCPFLTCSAGSLSKLSHLLWVMCLPPEIPSGYRCPCKYSSLHQLCLHSEKMSLTMSSLCLPETSMTAVADCCTTVRERTVETLRCKLGQVENTSAVILSLCSIPYFQCHNVTMLQHLITLTSLHSKIKIS